ncbi:MAG: Fe-S cluster assembly protein SufD [Candidatus Competibacterales bacterium]
MALADAKAVPPHQRSEFEQRLALDQPEFVRALRRAAWQRFETLGVPTRRHEMWRFTDIAPVTGQAFAIKGDSVPVDANRLPPPPVEDAWRLVLVNGQFHPGLSHLDGLPEGVVIRPLGEAFKSHPSLVEAYLDQVPGLETQPFAALNGALFGDGAFVFVPRGRALERPLHLVHWTTGDQVASYPRHLMVVEETAEACVVEEHRGEGHYFTCPLTEIHVAQGGRATFYKIQQEAAAGHHLGSVATRNARDSHLQLHLFNFGGAINRTDATALLAGEGSHSGFNGLTLVRERELGDYHLKVVHAVPHCTSEQTFKNVLDDRGRTVFDGMINVEPHAQKTDAIQDSRNLLLSKLAQAHANPRLEILADDVRCTHGSSTGFLDAEGLFYLRTRGIPKAKAQAMLVYAFANEALEAVDLSPLKTRLKGLLAERLFPDGMEVMDS